MPAMSSFPTADPMRPVDPLRTLRWRSCQLAHHEQLAPGVVLTLLRIPEGSLTNGTGPGTAQLGEDAHRYANRTGAPVFALLRTIAMNLLRRGGYRSSRQGLRELAYDIKGMLALGGVAPLQNTA